MTTLNYYIVMFAISFILLLLYLILWRKTFDVRITLIFVLITVTNLADMLTYTRPSFDTVLICQIIKYVGGCFLPWLISMYVAFLCKIRISTWFRILTFLLCASMFAGVLSIGHKPWFYKKLHVQILGNGCVITKKYGPLHTLFYVILGFFLLLSILFILYSFFRKNEVSRRILLLLFVPEVLTILGFFTNHLFSGNMELLPLTYVITLAVYLIIVRRLSIYEVNEMVAESLVEAGMTGFLNLDHKYHYLGSNETAKKILPALSDIKVDHKITDSEELKQPILRWIRHFEDKNANQILYPKGEQIFKVEVSNLYDGKRAVGYQIFLTDDTRDQKYISLLSKYRTDLEQEVQAKTAQIVEMHNKLILSLAVMVESRDNSTGGHIKRTSEGVRILIEAMRKLNYPGLSREFCQNLIKAAPMHDLGKIAVDDAILRKPGRFTDEEYEKMKMHAPEGGRIVHEILKDTDDVAFHILAENVAHYHHERWDGSGYPEGLSGERIPLEARIMAIADVYDALVSKRVYKDSFSFEKADRIIMEGMGTQFDPGLEQAYVHARPRLEEFYQGNTE